MRTSEVYSLENNSSIQELKGLVQALNGLFIEYSLQEQPWMLGSTTV